MSDDTKVTAPVSTEGILHARLDQIMTTLSGVNTKVDTVINGQLDHSAQLARLDTRVTSLEEARRNDSLPAKVVRVSENDSKQDAAIAELVVKVDALEAKVDGVSKNVDAIKDAVVGVINNPKVRLVGRVIFVIAAGYAAAKGLVLR